MSDFHTLGLGLFLNVAKFNFEVLYKLPFLIQIVF
jgi:hypothetical protein